jgi:transcription antitermination factor NusG
MFKRLGGRRMSFFAIQVRCGQEIDAKKMLKSVLEKEKDIRLNGIYALETFTQSITKNSKREEISEFLDDCEVAHYLQAKRTRENLSNLRSAYTRMDLDDQDAEMQKMRVSYQEEIAQQTKELNDMKCRGRKIRSVLKGYILLELEEDLFELPKKLWRLIKSVPKVSGIVSDYSIPDEEITQFFDQIDLTPSVEVCASEEIKSVEALEEEQNEALHTDNISTENGNQKPESVKTVEIPIEKQLEDIKEQTHEDDPLHRMIVQCQAFIRDKKEGISFPMPLLKYFYRKCSVHSFIGSSHGSDFIREFLGILRQEVSG